MRTPRVYITNFIYKSKVHLKFIVGFLKRLNSNPISRITTFYAPPPIDNPFWSLFLSSPTHRKPSPPSPSPTKDKRTMSKTRLGGVPNPGTQKLNKPTHCVHRAVLVERPWKEEVTKPPKSNKNQVSSF